MLQLLNGFWWGFLRRWFGGLFPDDKYKILSQRGLQTAIMLISLFPIQLSQVKSEYNDLLLVYQILTATVLTLWIHLQFWARGHGCILDEGREKDPDLTRYDRWYKSVLDFIWDLGYKLKQSSTFFNKLLSGWSCKKYGYSYDMWYTFMRYTLPMIVPALIYNNCIYLVIGALVPVYYEGTLRLYEHFPKLFCNFPPLNRANKLAEVLTGFTFGALILL